MLPLFAFPAMPLAAWTLWTRRSTWREAPQLLPFTYPPLAAVAGAYAQTLTGHEFHYASILAQPDAALARVTDANGDAVAETGSRRGHATGSFFHLIAESLTATT